MTGASSDLISVEENDDFKGVVRAAEVGQVPLDLDILDLIYDVFARLDVAKTVCGIHMHLEHRLAIQRPQRFLAERPRRSEYLEITGGEEVVVDFIAELPRKAAERALTAMVRSGGYCAARCRVWSPVLLFCHLFSALLRSLQQISAFSIYFIHLHQRLFQAMMKSD